MPAGESSRRFLEFPCTGVLNEWNQPVADGGSNLTDCNNLIYHRNGAWGRRPGASVSQIPNGPDNTKVSGYRWYRAFPTAVTKLVVYAQGLLQIGDNQFNLTEIGHYQLSGSTPPSFCTARDPQAQSGNGADVLIVTGLTLTSGSFGVGSVTITGLPGPLPTGSYIQLTAIDTLSNTVVTSKYIITGADNPQSIANGLCDLMNTTAAFLNLGSFVPFIGETYYTVPSPVQTDPTKQAVPQAIIHMGAQNGGAAGNGIQYGVTWVYADTGGTGPSPTPLAVFVGIGAGEAGVADNGTLNGTGTGKNFVQGGNTFSGPCKVENPTTSNPSLAGLTFHCSNPFAHCVSWHDHVWYWGDPNNPDTAFASDINQPEAFTFMIQNGGLNSTPANPQTGGYTVGVGDGDPFIQSLVPLGNALYVFKTANIYMIEGYDFQVGEYQFSLTPQVVGYGIPSPYCASVLDEQLVFWSGKKFCRLAVGSYEVEHIGLPIPITEGLCSTAVQAGIRTIAGDMQAQTLLNNVYFNGQNVNSPTTVIYRNIAIFSFNLGNNSFLNVMFDDEKSAAAGGYAWAKWTGWNVGYWIRYGLGPGAFGSNTDAPLMVFITPEGAHFCIAGNNALQDFGQNPIQWMAQTGWIDGGTPELIKNVNALYLNAAATAGATFSETVIPGRIVFPGAPSASVTPSGPQSSGASEYGPNPQTSTFQATLAPQFCEAENQLVQYMNDGQTAGQLPIQGKVIMVQINEPGESDAGFELRRFGFDVVEESLTI